MWLAVTLAALASAPKDRHGDPLPPGVTARYGTNRFCYGRFIDANTAAVTASSGTTLFNYSRPISQFAKEPGPLIGWDVVTGRETFRAAVGKEVWRVAFTADGRHRLDTLTDRRVRAWDTATSKAVGVFRLGDDRDSRPLGIVGDRLAVTDTVAGDVVVRLQRADADGHAPPAVTVGQASHVRLTPDGQTVLAVYARRRELRTFNATTGQLVSWGRLPIPEGELRRVEAEVRGGRLFVTGHQRGKSRPAGFVVAYHPTTRRVERHDFALADAPRPTDRVVTNDFGEIEVSEAGDYVAWIDLDYQLRIRHLPSGRVAVAGEAVSSDRYRFAGNRLAVVRHTDNVYLLDPASGRAVGPNESPAGAVEAVAVSPDGKLVAGGSDDGAVWVWDADTTKPLWHTDSGDTPVGRVQFDAAGQFVIASGWQARVAVFDARTGKPVGRELPSPSWAGKAVLDGGTRVLDVAADEEKSGPAFARVRELATGKEVRRAELEGSGGWQSSMQSVASADGKVIVLRRPSFGDLAVYDPATGKLLRTLSLPTGPYLCHQLDLSPDGRTLATRMTPSSMYDVPMHLIAFDVTTDRVLAKYSCGSKDDMFHTAVVSPDGRYAAGTIGKNGVTVVLDLRSGAKVRELSGETVAFFPDGRSVLTTPHIRGVERVSLEPAAWRARPPLKTSDNRLSQLWKDLAEPGEAGFDAVQELGRWPHVARPFLTKKLTEGVPDATELAALIAGLSAKAFADREAASKALREAGPGVVPALRAALKTDTNPEVRTRLEKAIHALTDASQPDALRWLRAEEVLERLAGVK